MSKKCLYTTLISLTILFLLLSIGALILFTHIDYFIDEQVRKVSILEFFWFKLVLIAFHSKQQAPFVNGSKPLEKWSNPSEDTKFRYTLYLFNVTNPQAVRDGSEKPRVRQLGPYEYLQKKTFHIYDWDHNENLLNFKMKRTFDRDETCKGDLNDTVTILNVPLFVSANEHQHLSIAY